jgi:hypothetical protein
VVWRRAADERPSALRRKFKLDKFLGSAWLAAMKIPEFKGTERFVYGVEFPCLVAKVKNSDFAVIAKRYVAISKRDPECKVFLRLQNLKHRSVWLQTMLSYIFEKDGISDGVGKVLRDFMNSDVEWACQGFEGKERDRIEKLGLASYFRMDVIVLDEVEKKVLVVGDTETELFQEHGECICFYKGRWRLDEWEAYSYQFLQREEAVDNERYTERWNTIFPAASKAGQAKGNALYGVWRFSPSETTNARLKCGVSENAIERGISQMKDIGWYFSPSKYESLVSGYTSDKWAVRKYKNQDNQYNISTKSSGGSIRSFWCDGKRLVPAGSKNVFTRVRTAYRKGKMF